jgi:hypothetical protein
MATVWLARDPKHERLVALKVQRGQARHWPATDWEVPMPWRARLRPLATSIPRAPRRVAPLSTRAPCQGENHPQHRLFDLGDMLLESGAGLPSAKLLYVTHGILDSARDNAILVPSYTGGTHRNSQLLTLPPHEA